MYMTLFQSESANVLMEIKLFTVSPDAATKESPLGGEAERRKGTVGKKRDDKSGATKVLKCRSSLCTLKIIVIKPTF